MKKKTLKLDIENDAVVTSEELLCSKRKKR